MKITNRDGAKKLCGAVIELAVKDWKRVKRGRSLPYMQERKSLRIFFYSEWFEVLCGLMDMDAGFIQETLEKREGLAQSGK